MSLSVKASKAGTVDAPHVDAEAVRRLSDDVHHVMALEEVRIKQYEIKQSHASTYSGPGDGSQFEGYPLPSSRLGSSSLCVSIFLGGEEYIQGDVSSRPYWRDSISEGQINRPQKLICFSVVIPLSC
jgi:hypothetical protein